MSDTSQPDQIARLARHLAEHLAPLCANVPAGELEELTTRLASAELSHAPVGGEAPEPLGPTPGNRVVWLPGSSGAAIVLPAGEGEATTSAALAQLLARVQQHLPRALNTASRGSAAVRQLSSALVAAYHERARVQLHNR